LGRHVRNHERLGTKGMGENYRNGWPGGVVEMLSGRYKRDARRLRSASNWRGLKKNEHGQTRERLSVSADEKAGFGKHERSDLAVAGVWEASSNGHN